MPCYSDAAKKVFEQWNEFELCQNIEDVHAELIKRRVDAIEFGDPKSISGQRRTKLSCHLLRQALLHRAERLIVSSGLMLTEKSLYGLALVVRGHVEGTAVLGYFCNRVDAFVKGNIPFKTFEANVADAVMGARHSLFENANTPPNIITSIEKADKFLNENLFGDKKEDRLQDTYSWLSDFAHPNFLSNSTAFRLDPGSHRMVFRHDADWEAADVHLVGYLSISGRLFLYLYDKFGEKVDTALND